MKMRFDFITNSSSAHCIIKNKTKYSMKMLDIVEMMLDALGPDLLRYEPFRDSYAYTVDDIFKHVKQWPEKSFRAYEERIVSVNEEWEDPDPLDSCCANISKK